MYLQVLWSRAWIPRLNLLGPVLHTLGTVKVDTVRPEGQFKVFISSYSALECNCFNYVLSCMVVFHLSFLHLCFIWALSYLFACSFLSSSSTSFHFICILSYCFLFIIIFMYHFRLLSLRLCLLFLFVIKFLYLLCFFLCVRSTSLTMRAWPQWFFEIEIKGWTNDWKCLCWGYILPKRNQGYFLFSTLYMSVIRVNRHNTHQDHVGYYSLQLCQMEVWS